MTINHIEIGKKETVRFNAWGALLVAFQFRDIIPEGASTSYSLFAGPEELHAVRCASMPGAQVFCVFLAGVRLVDFTIGEVLGIC